MIDRIASFFKRNHSAPLQYGAAFLLSLFSSFTLAGVFFKQNALYGDRYYFFSYFYDIIHSLSRFHEFPWWNPSAQDGLPHYYTLLLGLNFGNPVAMLMAGAAYLAGLLNIPLMSVTRLYVLYLGVLVPLVYMAGVAMCSRRFFRSNAAVLFVLVIAAFSPGMVTNLSDIGFEPAAFALLFVASFLHWLDHPERRSARWGMLLSALAALVCVNYLFLFWNLVFIPLFVAAWYTAVLRPAGKRLPSLPVGMLAVGGICLLIVIAPTIFAYFQGGDMVRRPMNTRVYEYYRIASGNPIQFLSVSLPAVVMKSCSYISYEEATRLLQSPYVYNYLGLLALPFAIIGLIWGKKPLRHVLYVLLALSMLVINLAAFSPIFSLLLMPKTPLQSVNHFSDLFYLTGAFILTVFAAGAGVDAIARYRATRIFKYMITILASGIGVMIIVMLLFYRHPMDTPAVGFFCTLALMLLVAIAWMARARSCASCNLFLALLIALTFVDVSTSAFLFARNTIWPFLQKSGQMNLTDPCRDSIGIPPGDMRAWYANTFLGLTSTIQREAAGFTTEGMPLSGTYTPRVVVHRANGTIEHPVAPDGVIVMHLADIDGSGTTEVVGRTPSGKIVTAGPQGAAVPCGAVQPGSVISFIDINGDRKDDLVEYQVDGEIVASLSNGTAFTTPERVAHLHPFFNKLLGGADISVSGEHDMIFLDIRDGTLLRLGQDGRQRCAGKIDLALIDNAMFRKTFSEISFADVNGDAKTDILFTTGTAVYAGISDAAGFGPLKQLADAPAREYLESSIVQPFNSIKATMTSYSRIAVVADLESPQQVVFRTSAAPFWKVIGGMPSMRASDLSGLMSVQMQAGHTSYELHYMPPLVPTLLKLAYVVIASVLAIWITTLFMEKKQRSGEQR